MTILQRFGKNTRGYDYVVGDIHGMFAMLRDRLQELSFNEETDRLFSVGDLVDRGPNSEESIEWVAKPWFHAVRGNHEQMAIGVAAGRHDRLNYMRNGGQWFLDLSASRQQLYAQAFDALPYMIEVETDNGLVGIVHAEILGNSWSEFASAMKEAPSKNKFYNLQEIALWARDRVRHKDVSKINDLSMLYVGHTPVQMATRLGNVMYIDTGAVFGRFLTVVQIQGAYVGP